MPLLKRILGDSPAVRRMARWYRARTDGYPKWERILREPRWTEARTRAKGGPKALVATSVGSFLPGTTLESLVAVALTLRGADVHFLLCDEILPACLETVSRWDAEPGRLTHKLCGSCYEPARKMFDSLGLTVHRYSQYLTPEERKFAAEIAAAVPMGEIGRYTLDGVAVGEHALAGTLRFFARGTLDGEPDAESVLRDYFRAGLLTFHAVRRLLRTVKFETSLFNHGIYVPQGIIGDLARQEGVRVSNWTMAYRKNCFLFSEGDTYHHTYITEPVANWENLELTPERERQLMEYLQSRWQGTRDWLKFNPNPQEDVAAIARELGVDFSKPCIGMLTNVMWDAQLNFKANAFESMLDWVVQTLAYFAKRPDLQLLVRVHPAEIRGTLPSRQPIIPEIRKRFPDLPKNIILIPPDSPVSTYVAMAQCNAVILFGTTTGIDLATQGIPVIVAGEAYVRGKGVTIDASSAADYLAILDRLPLPGRMSEEQVRRARKYAYHFFFRRMIPVDFLEPAHWPPYRIPDGAFDRIGADPGLDVICRGILEGSPFICTA